MTSSSAALPLSSERLPDYGRFTVRGATCADLDAIAILARHLNTVNLPDDRAHLTKLLACSEASFLGQLPVAHRKYVFLLWDDALGRAVGSSTIISKLGRRDAPYIYFDVLAEERYSKALDRHFQHEILRLGFSYDGPTELGGLVIEPSYRRSPEALGRFISYVRFAFIAAHRALFEAELLAELLPPLERDGTSHLWEALGRRFTNMSYAEADLMSSHDKDFIHDLFPRGDIYTTLLEPKAREVVGRVGEASRGVERMLRAVGFRYAWRVDPFDGGPHFIAATDEVPLISRAQRVVPRPLSGHTSTVGIVLHEQATPPFVQATLTSLSVAEHVAVPESTLDRVRDWGWSSKDPLWCMGW